MEGSAFFVYEKINAIIKKLTNDRAWLSRVEVRENEKNSAIYSPLND
jgi:6-pyruvoyltetrahydropterin/6-carboxytetrahydropterin synthase